MTPSNSFQYTINSSDLPNKKPYRKLSEVSCSRISENISEGNKHSREDRSKTPQPDAATTEDTDHDRHQTAHSKSTKLKDFSKKFLKRVNSGNHNYYNNIKKNFKSTNFNRLKKNHDVNSSNNSDKEFDKENFPNQRGDSTGSNGHVDRNSGNEDSLNISSPTAGAASQNPSQNKSNFYLRTISKTNSIDRSNHFKYPNADNNSISGNNYQSFDIKEFEKKLINLPTFTISDENSLQSILPNAISSTSLLSNAPVNGTNCQQSGTLTAANNPTGRRKSSTDLSDNLMINADKTKAFSSNNISDQLISSNTSLKDLSHSLKTSVSTEIIRVTKQNSSEEQNDNSKSS